LSLLPQELIRRKRDGLELSEADIEGFFGGFLQGSVADYQVGAMLMAITLRGMNSSETATLTRVMRNSGTQLTWPYDRQLIVDKHSTGGIGDKTSMIILPLVLCEGLKVPMMAGRGLGHTGGTLDKLEAVGWSVFLSPEQIRAQMATLGGVVMGQTEQMVPLDRLLYAMRDVTGTVESIPLIVGSILSKKLAEGIGGLVLDIKYGSGAFMANKAEAIALAKELGQVGRSCGLAVQCTLSDMGSPLGTYAGNALEMIECCDVLRGKGPDDTRILSLHLATEMVLLAHPERDRQSIWQRLEKHLHDGTAWHMFLRLAEAQGGNTELLQNPERLLKAPIKKPVNATGGPVVTQINTRLLGLAIVALGGGRRLANEKINPWVGLSDLKRVGTKLEPGEPVAVIHAADASSADVAHNLVAEAYRLGEHAACPPLFEEIS
jgi:pyrimidine-nucleoside phosphorylase